MLFSISHECIRRLCELRLGSPSSSHFLARYVMYCILNCNKFWSNMTRVCDYSQHIHAVAQTHTWPVVKRWKGWAQHTRVEPNISPWCTPLSARRICILQKGLHYAFGSGAYFGEWEGEWATVTTAMHSYTAFFGWQVEAMNFLTIMWMRIVCRYKTILSAIAGGLLEAIWSLLAHFHVIWI